MQPSTAHRHGRVPGVRWAVAALVAFVAVVVYDVIQLLRLHAGRPPPRKLEHDGVVGKGAGDPVRVTVLGDSAAAGHGLDDPDLAFPRQLASYLVRERGRPVELTSLAEDGARLEDLTRQQVPFMARDAELVVAAAGVNDALARRRPEEVELATAELVAAIRERSPAAQVVLVGCPDLRTAPGFPWPLNHLVGWSCRRTCDAQARGCRGTGVRFVRYPEPPGREMYGVDGFHPGPLGQAAAARATLDVLRGG